MTKNKCDKCKFWDKLPNDGTEPFDYGRCKRYPPQTDLPYILWEIKEAIQKEYDFPMDIKPQFENNWPVTYASDWCGEFKLKIIGASIPVAIETSP